MPALTKQADDAATPVDRQSEPHVFETNWKPCSPSVSNYPDHRGDYRTEY
jgi:hypothetical protein